MQTLTPGMNAPLPTGQHAQIRVTGAQAHVDPVVLLLDAHRRADGDNGVVLFSNPTACCGAVHLNVQTDVVTVDLAALPAQVETVLVVAQADGQPTVQSAGQITTTVAVDGQPAATYLEASPAAVATLRLVEVYRRNGQWKVRALGDGYADGLPKLLTVHGVEITDEPARAPVAPPVNLEKQRIIDLRKKVEQAPREINLLKKFDAAAVNLEKKGLLGQRARVVLVLDMSGSSRPLFANGAYQELAERVFTAGLLFDDDGRIDTVLFDTGALQAEPVDLSSYSGWANRQKKTWGGTCYAPPLKLIARDLRRGDPMPTYIAFITDGGNSDRRDAADTLKRMAELPAFVQFIAIGDERDFPSLQRLDDLKGREVDNADFFAVENPRALSDDEFFAKMMNEFPGWLTAAKSKGIVGA